MTARHATPLLSVETEEAGATRSIAVRDHSGLVLDELIIEARPSRLSAHGTDLALEIWSGMEIVAGSLHLTPTQLRALAAFCDAAARDGEVRL